MLERLFAAYEDRHTITVIETVANECQAQLDGRTPRAPDSSSSNDWPDTGSTIYRHHA